MGENMMKGKENEEKSLKSNITHQILIQPPGEPWEDHLGEVRPKKFELSTQYFKKDKIVQNSAKTLKMKSQDWKHIVFG